MKAVFVCFHVREHIFTLTYLTIIAARYLNWRYVQSLGRMASRSAFSELESTGQPIWARLTSSLT